MSSRLLDPKALPASLWESVEDILRLPPALADAYMAVIGRHGLRELAMARDMNNPPVGGLDQESTDMHLAQAFDGSCARAQLALLDPKGRVPQVSDAFVASLAGNSVSVTDAPCGAGAGAFSLLATLGELRARDVLPRQPLNVALVGAELSAPARAYAAELLAELAPFLKSQAIFVEPQLLDWDVTSQLSNTDLVRRITVASEGRSKRLLLIANFNSFLEKERKKKLAQPQLAELFRYMSGENSLALWIEPNMNRATNGLFPWLRVLLKSTWAKFARELGAHDGASPGAVSTGHFRPPLAPDTVARVGLAVVAIDLDWQR